MITIFLPYNGSEHTLKTIEKLKNSKEIEKIYLISKEEITLKIDNCETLITDFPFGSGAIKLINDNTPTDYILLITQDTIIDFGQFAIERFLEAGESTGAGLLYSNYYEVKGNDRITHPVLDYQTGSIRDDFEFGPVVMIKKE
ncbi:MAG TPA: glycosyltransferase family 2 protein, partial [Ignavibacteria bacterium]|nr:glycosyltransferase family 2 protein [Ignavibacteria bacterium]